MTTPRMQVRAPTHGSYVCSRYPSIVKKRIGVEDLLVWAYRDQMVHVAKDEALLEVGSTRGPGGVGGGFALEPVDACAPGWFTAAPDAFAVHEVVSGLARVQAHLPADVIGRVNTMALSATALPDVKRGFMVRRSEIVMSCAIDGRRPDWVPEPVIKIERGETIYARRHSGQIKRDARGVAIETLQLVRFVGDMPWEVERARLIYQLWVAALGAVRAALAGALKRHDLTDALPAARPWELT